VFEIRIHGRGGQGVVTAAEMLSVAAFMEDRHAQAFPSFGSERMGAPVVSFCRIDERPIRLREPIAEPDAVIVGDPTLLNQVDVFGGLKADGFVLINTSRSLGELGVADLFERFRRERMATVPATELARQYVGRPLPNAALLGGFAALTEQTMLQSVLAAVRERFKGDVGERNVAVAEHAFAHVRGAVAAGRTPAEVGASAALGPTPTLRLSPGTAEGTRA
jgi:pyruvate ferredoxin oxidoreductase gamma subunit